MAAPMLLIVTSNSPPCCTVSMEKDLVAVCELAPVEPGSNTVATIAAAAIATTAHNVIAFLTNKPSSFLRASYTGVSLFLDPIHTSQQSTVLWHPESAVRLSRRRSSHLPPPVFPQSLSSRLRPCPRCIPPGIGSVIRSGSVVPPVPGSGVPADDDGYRRDRRFSSVMLMVTSMLSGGARRVCSGHHHHGTCSWSRSPA